jgi:hypothetical protein
MGALQEMQNNEQQQAVNKLKIQAETLDLKKKMDEDKLATEWHPFTDMDEKGAAFPESTNILKDTMKKLGLAQNINGVDSWNIRGKEQASKIIGFDEKLRADVASAKFRDYQGQLTNYKSQLAELSKDEASKGKNANDIAFLTKKIGETTTQRDALQNQWSLEEAQKYQREVEKAKIVEREKEKTRQELLNQREDLLRARPEQEVQSAFEARFPQWKGKLGTPEYAEAINDFEKRKQKDSQEKNANAYDDFAKGYIAKLKANPATAKMTDDQMKLAVAKAYNDMTKIAPAQIRVEAFQSLPTSTPGIYFDRVKKQYMKTNPGGNPIPLTPKEQKEMNLEFKEETPTNDIKVMRQSVPSVLALVDKTDKLISNTEQNLGPASSRWRDFKSGKVGAADPEFRGLYSATELLKSRLTKMHFGSKGGEKIVERFDKMIDASKDSPENMRSTLNVIRDYANEVAREPINLDKNQPLPKPIALPKPATSWETLKKQKGW